MTKASILVLAGSRAGAEDPVARLKGVSHKCLAPIDGVVMLERVLRGILDAGVFGQIYVAIESKSLLRTVPALAAWLDQGVIIITPCKANLADSVLAATQAMTRPVPLVITTGDNALQTPELLQDFMVQFTALKGDLAIAFTSAKTVKKDYPEVGLAYHRLRDGGYSSCNLYGFRTEKALKSAQVFRGGGQFGKRQWRILSAFGLVPFIWYKLRAATLSRLIARIARNLSLSADIIMLDYAYGPIDVDNIAFFEISEAALKARRKSVGKDNA